MKKKEVEISKEMCKDNKKLLVINLIEYLKELKYIIQ